MSVNDVWLQHLRELVRLEGGGRDGYRAVATKAGIKEEYVYQLAAGVPRPDGSPRRVGITTAGRLAKAYADGRPEDWINQPLEAAARSLREPSPYSIDGLLSQLGGVLAQVPPSHRNMVAEMMAAWVRDGGAEHYHAPLAHALRTPSKRQSQAA